MKALKFLSFVISSVIAISSFTFTCSASETDTAKVENISVSQEITPTSVPVGQGVYMSGFAYDFTNDSECIGIEQFEGNRLTVSATVVSVLSGDVSKVYVRVYQQSLLGVYTEVATGSFTGTSGTHTVISGAKINPNRNIKFVAWVEGTNQPSITIGIGAVASNY